jgi:hypothetical protein
MVARTAGNLFVCSREPKRALKVVVKHKLRPPLRRMT